MDEFQGSHSSSGWWFMGGTVLLAITLFVRVISYPVITSDYTYFIAKWWDALGAHPWLTAFHYPFADYAPLYLYILKALTFIPIPSLYSVKTLSFLSDVCIAIFACAILKRLQPTRWARGKLFFAFALMLSLPTVVLNSSLWGQSDALYAAFVIAALYYMLIDLRLTAVILFGVACCLKVQSLFFLPVLAGYLLARGSLRLLFVVPLIFLLFIIPAWLGGGNFFYWLFIYGKQAGEYIALTVNAPSIFAFFYGVPSTAEPVLFWGGIAFALLSAVAAFVLAARASKQRSGRLLIAACLFCALALPFFLPRMHERYFYLADIFSVLLALHTPRKWYLPVLVVAASLLSYMHYLSGAVPFFSMFVVDLRIGSILLIGALAGIMAFILRRGIKKQAI